MFPRNWGGKRRFPLYCLIAWHCVELGSGRAFIALSRRTLDYSHNAFRLTRKNRQRHGRPAGKTVSFRPFRGSPRFSAAVAQWIEYWPPKPRVVGSIPASRATSIPAAPSCCKGNHKFAVWQPYASKLPRQKYASTSTEPWRPHDHSCPYTKKNQHNYLNCNVFRREILCCCFNWYALRNIN